MKNFDGPIKGLFEDAERLTPRPGLWRAIEARSGLGSGARDPGLGARHARAGVAAQAEETDAIGPGFWGGPWIRLAASVVLAAGLLGLGVIFKERIGQGNAAAASAVQSSIDSMAMAQASADTEIVDPELLGWHADLGEMDEEADEAEEIL